MRPGRGIPSISTAYAQARRHYAQVIHMFVHRQQDGWQPAGAAVVRVVAVDQDGQVHFAVLPGSLEKNRHLIGHALA